ncbi:MAG: Sec-independent protein translocase protein TatB [Acidimicrobiales bacterium]
MLNLGTPELLVILLVALIVLGPAKLPEAARKMAQAMNEFRRMSSGLQAELRDALDPLDLKGERAPGTINRPGETPVIAVEEADAAALGDEHRTAGDADDLSAN